MNNYEKIKNMSLDEMAKIIRFKSFIECQCCVYHNGCLATEYQRKRCLDGIKQWLLSEVE